MRDEAIKLPWADDEEVTRLLGRIDVDVTKWTATVSEVMSAVDQETRRIAAQQASRPNAETQTIHGPSPASRQDFEPGEVGSDAGSDPTHRPPGPAWPPIRSDAIPSPSPESAPGDDQALLLSLDAEAQRWIRVKQRISGARSVRELLAEYQAASSKKRE